MKSLKKAFILFSYSFVFLFAPIVYAQNNPTIDSIEIDSENEGVVLIVGNNLFKNLARNELAINVLIGKENKCSPTGSALAYKAVEFIDGGKQKLKYSLPDIRSGAVCVFDKSNNKLLLKEGFVLSRNNTKSECMSSLKKEGAISFSNKGKNIISLNELKIDAKCVGIPLFIEFQGLLVNRTFKNSCFYKKYGSAVDLYLRNNGKQLDNHTIKLIPENKKVTVYLRTDEDSCSGDDYKPECHIYTNLYVGEKKKENKISTKDSLINVSNSLYKRNLAFCSSASHRIKSEKYFEGEFNKTRTSVFDKGAIIANCDGKCGRTDWMLLGIKGAKHDYGNAINSVVEPQKPVFDTKSPCYKSYLNDGEGGYLPGCYEFLAPIDFDANGGNLNGVQSKEGRTWIENIREFRFGDYVNFLFRIAISALVIISVVMIMVAGIEYMTVESLFGKSQAKARIKGAVGGLILALASYTILHTLNPKLLDMSALDNMEVAKVGGDEPATIDKNGSIICKGGPRKYNGVLLKAGKSQEWKPETFGKKAGDWIDVRDLIKQGKYDDVIKIKNGKCTYVGDACTSMKFEGPVASKVYSALVNLANDLQLRKNKKTIVITGGSEMWKHCTHGPSSPILDIRSNSTGGNNEIGLAKLFAGDNASGFPAQCFDRTNLGLSYVSLAKDETLPSTYKKTRKSGIIKKKDSKVKDAGCSWKPADHWHIIFK